jgi:hypothetical protein
LRLRARALSGPRFCKKESSASHDRERPMSLISHPALVSRSYCIASRCSRTCPARLMIPPLFYRLPRWMP